MEKEEKLMQKRFLDLANRSFSQNMYTFSEFLSLADQTTLWSMKEELQFAVFSVFGGHEECERVMVRFGSCNQLGYVEEYPITCIEMKPFIEKFADDFSHRDFLGALMNLGIKRETLGDIFIQDKIGYLYCTTTMANFIIEHLTQVKHTHIQCRALEDMGVCIVKEKLRKEITVSSQRIDAVIAKVYNVSRTKSLDLFRLRNVFANGRVLENNSYLLKAGDVISVRGYGKFIYSGVQYETKKGKVAIAVELYV
ncbi:MAG: YlmH/Sll1252 family protein [Eubacteriales bacterium]